MTSRQDYLNTIKGLAYSSIKESLIKAIVAKLPFLGSSILNPILAYVVGKILTIIFEETEMRIFFAYTDFRIGRQGQEFSNAITLFKKGEINEQEFINSFRTLVKYSS
jgi:hypothetical protein